MRIALKIALVMLMVLLSLWATAGTARVYRDASIVEQELMRDHRILGSTLLATLDRHAGAYDSTAAIEALFDSIELAERAIDLSVSEQSTPVSDQSIEGDTLVTLLPLELQGRRYQLQLREPLTEVARVTREGRAEVLGGGGLMVVIGLLGAALGGHWVVGQRMECLVRRSRDIGAGKLHRDLQVFGKDEIGTVALALEELAQQLARSQTAEHQAQEARIAAIEQVRHADRLRLVGDLAAGIAHELGSPLHVVAGNAQLLASDDALDAEARQTADIISEQAHRMDVLVQRLLELAHPAPPAHESVQLAALWQQLRTTAEGLARGTSVRIELGAAPEGAARLPAAGFIQSLANLVRNGVQAHQGEPGVVQIHARTDAGALVVVVDDDGPGIPDPLRQRVFSPFFTTKAPGEGLGLGLALVQGIVREAGGTLQLEDSPLGGARFTLTFPLDPAVES